MLLYLGHATEHHPGLPRDVRGKIHSMLDPIDRVMITIAHNRGYNLYCTIAGQCKCDRGNSTVKTPGAYYDAEHGKCKYDADFTYLPGACCYSHELAVLDKSQNQYDRAVMPPRDNFAYTPRICDFTTIKIYCARGGYYNLLLWCMRKYRSEASRHGNTHQFWAEALVNCHPDTLNLFTTIYNIPHGYTPGSLDYSELAAAKCHNPQPALDWLRARGLQNRPFAMFRALIARGMTDLAMYYLELTTCWCGRPGVIAFGLCDKHRTAYCHSSRKSVLDSAMEYMVENLHTDAAKFLWNSGTTISKDSIARSFRSAKMYREDVHSLADMVDWLKSIGAEDVIDLSCAYYNAAGCRVRTIHPHAVTYSKVATAHSLDVIKWLYAQGVPMPHPECAGNTAFLAAHDDLLEWALSIGIVPQLEHLTYAVDYNRSALNILLPHIKMTPLVANKLLHAGILIPMENLPVPAATDNF